MARFQPVRNPAYEETLADKDRDQGIPARSALDWRDRPVPETPKIFKARLEEYRLDIVLNQLYHKSPTFRALVHTTPAVEKQGILSNIFRTKVEAQDTPWINVKFDPFFHADARNLPIALWIVAQHAREKFQAEKEANFVKDDYLIEERSASLNSYLTLNRALKADSHAFAATCVFETLAEMKKPQHEIEASLEDTLVERIMLEAAALAYTAPLSARNGHAGTVAFTEYMDGMNAEVLRRDDHRLLTRFNPLGVLRTKEEQTPPDAFADRFAKLREMPWLNNQGNAVPREAYLADVAFDELKHLPHTGIRNKLHAALILTPFSTV